MIERTPGNALLETRAMENKTEFCGTPANGRDDASIFTRNKEIIVLGNGTVINAPPDRPAQPVPPAKQ